MQLSRYESFGVALVEAMWCGCTPIVSDAGALPEVVGDAGEIVNADDEDAVASAVSDATSRPSTNERAVRRAREFSVERRRAALHEAVELVLSCHRKGAGQ